MKDQFDYATSTYNLIISTEAAPIDRAKWHEWIGDRTQLCVEYNAIKAEYDALMRRKDGLMKRIRYYFLEQRIRNFNHECAPARRAWNYAH
jgi:hypothetical protein